MQLREADIIARLAQGLGLGRTGLQAIGDDGALLAAEDRLVVTDTMVEGRHFNPAWSSWSDVGFKLLARNVSDIFAMGGRPTAMLLTLALPRSFGGAELEAFAQGLEAASARWCNPVLIGGDTTATEGPAVLALTLFGKTGLRTLRRSGGQPRDRLWVDGPLGLAAAGLSLLRQGRPEASEEAVRAHRRPGPTPLLPGAVRAASACIDISDGLLLDAARLADASGCGLRIRHRLPGLELLLPLAADLSEAIGWQRSGGDDYLRLVACPRSPGRGWHEVGALTEARGIVVEEPDGSWVAASADGYLHTFGAA